MNGKVTKPRLAPVLPPSCLDLPFVSSFAHYIQLTPLLPSITLPFLALPRFVPPDPLPVQVL